MSEPTGQNSHPTALDDDIRALTLEQWRLRGEIDRLREEHRQLLEEKPSKNSGSEEKKEEGDRQKQDGGKQQSGDKQDKKQEDGKDGDQKEKPKPPLKQRASAWVRQHPLGVVLLLAALIAFAIAGYLLWNYLQSYVSTDDAEVDGHIDQIASRVAGTIIAVYVENNRSVVQGQTLADLDPRDYQTALAQAKANLAQAVAALEEQAPNIPITQTTQSTNVSTALKEVSSGGAAVQAARQSHASALADLAQAEAQAQNAASEERRYRALVEKDEISREIYDQKVTAARAQQALVASRRAAAEAAAKSIEQREAELAEARDRSKAAQNNQPREVAVQHTATATREANVKAAQAQVEQARLNLSYCKIAAPVAGIVGDKTAEVGQQITPGQELLAITPTDDLWVTANFKETQIQNMHPGQRVTLHVDAIDLDFEGFIQNMPGATGARYSLLPPENATGNYVKVVQRLPVRIRFKPGQKGFERLRPGMSVEPKVWVK